MLILNRLPEADEAAQFPGLVGRIGDAQSYFGALFGSGRIVMDLIENHDRVRRTMRVNQG